MHSIDMFAKGYGRFLGSSDDSKNTENFSKWVASEGICLFEEAFKDETGLSVPKLPDGLLIDQAYPSGVNDLSTKTTQNAFYAANARIFVDVCGGIANTVQGAFYEPCADQFAYRYYELLKRLVLDAHSLLQHWADSIHGIYGVYGIGKNPWHDAFQLSVATNQLMYSWAWPFAPQDNATDAGAALLRVAIETRVRFGFGLLGVVEKKTGAVQPLNLSVVLKVLKDYEQQMTLAVPVKDIIRIYGWSNIYMHIGQKLYTWTPIFAHRYLKQFLQGGAHMGGYHNKCGIVAGEEVIREIQEAVLKEMALCSGQELITISPEKCSVVSPSWGQNPGN